MFGKIANVPTGTVIDQQRKRKEIDMGSGVLTVTTNKRQRRQIQHRRTDINHDESRERDFVAKIIFKPKTSEVMLTVSVDQSQFLRGSFLSIPRLSINTIIPTDSEIFELATSGRVEDLMAFVAEGKGSLRDHDPRGRSLLHVRTNPAEF